MKKIGFLGLCLLAAQVFAQSDIMLDGVWCSQGKGKDLWQWGNQTSANVLEKDQLCLVLKVTKMQEGVAVGRAVTRFVMNDDTPTNASSQLKSGLFSDRAVFAFSPHQGGYRLRMADVTDTTHFDLMLVSDNLLQGFVMETGEMRKSLTDRAFAAFVRFEKTGPLPDDFETLWADIQPTKD